MQLNWSHAVVYVHDMPAMLDFYTTVLGFEIADRGPVAGDGSPEIVFLSQSPTDHHQLAFLDNRESVAPSNSVNHFAFRVDALADVRAMIRRLEDDGRASQLRPISHGNAWSIYFQDPERNGIEVFCDTPFHVAQPQWEQWDPAVDDDELLAWTRATFEKRAGFGPIEGFYRARRAHLEQRETPPGGS